MLMGEYHHNIDDKLRLVIPNDFRNDLGDKVIVTRGLDNCLFVYSEKEWSNIVSKLKTLPFTKKDARIFTRILLSGATICEFDKQGRIKLSSVLSTYANLTKECVVIGVNDRLEIWSKDNWDNYFNTNNEYLSEASDHLFNGELDG